MAPRLGQQLVVIQECDICGKVTKNSGAHKFLAHIPRGESWKHKTSLRMRGTNYALGHYVSKEHRNRLCKFVVDNELWRYSYRKYEYQYDNAAHETGVLWLRSWWEVE